MDDRAHVERLNGRGGAGADEKAGTGMFRSFGDSRQGRPAIPIGPAGAFALVEDRFITSFRNTRPAVPRLRAIARRAAASFALVLLAATPGYAQNRRCDITTYTDPPREELSCPGGLKVVAEKASDYQFVDRNRDGRPEAIDLRARALLIDLPGRTARRNFQILTPHAIAAVRGTVWSVDVSAARTSVFVRDGTVAVSRPGDPRAVILRPGEGVDVDAGTEPLVVRTWPADRVAHLFARFGR
jgi:ferric-dicitrate binding protein FerR (iron transport regulator)